MTLIAPPYSCDRCSDTGWCQVTEHYVDRLAPWPSLPEPITEAEHAGHAQLMEDARRKRAAVANSSFPCPDCQPAMFDRWAAGHMHPDHDARTCPDCGGRPRKATAPTAARDLPHADTTSESAHHREDF